MCIHHNLAILNATKVPKLESMPQKCIEWEIGSQSLALLPYLVYINNVYFIILNLKSHGPMYSGSMHRSKYAAVHISKYVFKGFFETFPDLGSLTQSPQH